jgi:hypothetical protein
VKTPHTFNTVADLLLSQPLTIDVEIDDAWSGPFAVKGLEVRGVVLYVGLPGFSILSLELEPAEVLIYRNMFLSWMRRLLEKERFCIVERFLDNAAILVFSRTFGSEDPFFDALQVSRILGENDEPGFRPSIGIACGSVFAGFTGSPGEYAAAVYGRPVMLAAGCAAMKPSGEYAASITFPEAEWTGRSLDRVFPPLEYEDPEKGKVRQPQTWKLGETRLIDIPGTGKVAVRDIASFVHWMSDASAETKTKEWFGLIRSKGYYKNNR